MFCFVYDMCVPNNSNTYVGMICMYVMLCMLCMLCMERYVRSCDDVMYGTQCSVLCMVCMYVCYVCYVWNAMFCLVYDMYVPNNSNTYSPRKKTQIIIKKIQHLCRMCVYMCTHMCLHVRTCVHMCVHVFTCACMCVRSRGKQGWVGKAPAVAIEFQHLSCV